MPALNEQDNIGSVIDTIFRVMGNGTVVLVVDDGSSDKTAKVAEERNATVIQHHKNLGLGQSFRDITKFSLQHGADLLVTIDADGQFNPEEIPRLIEPITTGRADFVAGSRFTYGISSRPINMPIVKYYGNLCMNCLIRGITGRFITDASSGFRAYSKEALLHLNLHGSFTYTQETFLDLATKNIDIEQIPVSVKYRQGRKSRIVTSIARYTARSIATILRTVRDHRPLLVFGFPSIVFCFLGTVAAGFTLIHYFETGSFSPYIFLAFTGAYLFTLGFIIGIIGIASDMLRPIRRNQEEMLYILKSQKYYPNEGFTNTAPIKHDD